MHELHTFLACLNSSPFLPLFEGLSPMFSLSHFGISVNIMHNITGSSAADTLFASSGNGSHHIRWSPIACNLWLTHDVFVSSLALLFSQM